MPSGIYKIECTVTGKIYVGSAVNLYRRWKAHHLPSLRAGTHCNSYLQRAWNKYGERAFVHVILEIVSDVKQLLVREQHWIDALHATTAERGFNLCAVAGSSLGRKHDRKTLVRMAAVHSKSYVVRSPSGHEQVIVNLSAFCREHGLTSQAMVAVAKGKKSHHKSWECRYLHQSRRAWLSMLKAPTRKRDTFVGDTKWCPDCRAYLPLTAFSLASSTAHGVSCYCQKHRNARSRKHYQQTSEVC